MTENLSLVAKRKYVDSGLDKEQFAKVIGVSLPQLYLMLRGDSNPSLLIVIEIARRRGLGMWELLGVEPVGVEEPAGRVRHERSKNSPSPRSSAVTIGTSGSTPATFVGGFAARRSDSWPTSIGIVHRANGIVRAT